nr:MAG TPA: tail lysozyme [Caudoviricetes sp.]
MSDATRVFMNQFERPHKDYANFSRRLRFANSIS